MSPHPPGSLPPRRRQKNASYRKLLWLGAGAAAGGVAALFGAQAWLESYLQGEAFRKRTEAAIGRTLHAACEISPIQRQGIALTADVLRLEGREGASFKRAQAQSPRAEVDLGAVWHRVWKLESLRFQRLELNLDAPEPSPETPSAETPPPPPAHWWTALLPRKTEIDSIHTDRATLTRSGATLKDARLDAKPSDGGWEILLEAGELKWPGMPAMELAQCKLLSRPGADATGKARVLVKNGGQVALTGGWTKEAGTDIHGQLENIDVQPFLPSWWQSRLHGTLQGTLRFTQRQSGGEGELSGNLKLTGATLEALPLLAQLDAFTRNTRFSRIPLKNASFHLSKTPERTEFRDVDLDAGGILRITGNVSVHSGALRGDLRLGISSSLIQWLPETRTKIFAEARDGYVWAPFEISGTSEDPKENLSARLASAAIETATDVLKDLPGRLPQALPEAAKGVLDAVKSMVPKPF